MVVNREKNVRNTQKLVSFFISNTETHFLKWFSIARNLPTGLEVNLRRPEGLKSDENAILSETYLKSAMRAAYAP